MPPRNSVIAASRKLTIGNVSPKCDVDILWELCTQFGVVEHIHIPQLRIPGGGRDDTLFCNVTFAATEDAKYCYEALTKYGVTLFDKELSITHEVPVFSDSHLCRGMKRHRDVELFDIGAKVLVSNINLDKSDYEIESFFREKFRDHLTTMKRLTDKDGNFRGKVILSFKSFEASDHFIEEMNKYFLFDRVIIAEYAKLENSQTDRHGSQMERESAAKMLELQAAHEREEREAQAAASRKARERSATDTIWARR